MLLSAPDRGSEDGGTTAPRMEGDDRLPAADNLPEPAAEPAPAPDGVSLILLLLAASPGPVLREWASLGSDASGAVAAGSLS